MCEKPYYSRKYPYPFPCGSCPSCRQAMAKSWQVRLTHEKKYHRGVSYFLTLTYDRLHCPINYSLYHRDVQLYMKRLRKSSPDDRVKYFCAGEYGDKGSRPHYHMIIFGYNGDANNLTKLWGNGDVDVGICTVASAGYCAGYCYKKLKKKSYGHRKPPYIACSRGLGEKWILDLDNQHKSFSDGFCTFQGIKYPIPRYYFKKAGLDRAKYYKCFIEKQSFEEIKRLELFDAKSVPYDENTLYPIEMLTGPLDFIACGHYTLYNGRAYKHSTENIVLVNNLRRSFNDAIRFRTNKKTRLF